MSLPPPGQVGDCGNDGGGGKWKKARFSKRCMREKKGGKGKEGTEGEKSGCHWFVLLHRFFPLHFSPSQSSHLIVCVCGGGWVCVAISAETSSMRFKILQFRRHSDFRKKDKAHHKLSFRTHTHWFKDICPCALFTPPSLSLSFPLFFYLDAVIWCGCLLVFCY